MVIFRIQQMICIYRVLIGISRQKLDIMWITWLLFTLELCFSQLSAQSMAIRCVKVVEILFLIGGGFW